MSKQEIARIMNSITWYIVNENIKSKDPKVNPCRPYRFHKTQRWTGYTNKDRRLSVGQIAIQGGKSKTYNLTI